MFWTMVVPPLVTPVRFVAWLPLDTASDTRDLSLADRPAHKDRVNGTAQVATRHRDIV